MSTASVLFCIVPRIRWAEAWGRWKCEQFAHRLSTARMSMEARPGRATAQAIRGNRGEGRPGRILREAPFRASRCSYCHTAAENGWISPGESGIKTGQVAEA